jgi:hypothetical protein
MCQPDQHHRFQWDAEIPVSAPVAIVHGAHKSPGISTKGNGDQGRQDGNLNPGKLLFCGLPCPLRRNLILSRSFLPVTKLI